MNTHPTTTRRFLGAFAAVAALGVGSVGTAAAATRAPLGTAKTLVLYDATGPWAALGELYAMNVANLAGRFGTVTSKPVAKYVASENAAYTGVVYVGSTYDEALPAAFLNDVKADTKPTLWMNHNIWQLTASDPSFLANRGWTWKGFDSSPVPTVTYKATALDRSSLNNAPIMDTVIADPTKATVLAEAKRADGTSFPWAVRSGKLTYIGEMPLSYVGETDRSLALSDLMYDLLAPQTATRHRALARIEDVGPDADPAQLRRIADYLSSKQVPFSVAVYPRYVDSLGVDNGGIPVAYNLKDRPLVVAALKYMQTKGGTLIMHGYTHQFSNLKNPYDGKSANDFEFFAAHVDAGDNVIYDGPVPGDSAAFATGRINTGRNLFSAAGLTVPNIFEFPHYAGSFVDYTAVKNHKLIAARYERGLYYVGQSAGKVPNHQNLVGQFFPYPVVDINSTLVLPENLGNFEPLAFNNRAPRLPSDIVDAARRNLVIRDGFASFFYHPYFGDPCPVPKGTTPCLDDLKTITEGIQGHGYTFVSSASLLANG